LIDNMVLRIFCHDLAWTLAGAMKLHNII
jgi:hypothetical protein